MVSRMSPRLDTHFLLVKIKPVGVGSPIRVRSALIVLEGSWISILEYLETIMTPIVLIFWMAKNRPGQACL